MADHNPSQAMGVISRIEMMCVDRQDIQKAIDDAIPYTGITRERGALGFDTPIWVGLGTVGIWAALDAYSERAGWIQKPCAKCRRNSCIQEKFRRQDKDNEEAILGELDDLRHLYAHNYAGNADASYFAKKRHVLASGIQTPLTCGAAFNGQQLHLQLCNLRSYANAARKLLQRLT
jgi:hypothetical protein